MNWHSLNGSCRAKNAKVHKHWMRRLKVSSIGDREFLSKFPLIKLINQSESFQATLSIPFLMKKTFFVKLVRSGAKSICVQTETESSLELKLMSQRLESINCTPSFSFAITRKELWSLESVECESLWKCGWYRSKWFVDHATHSTIRDLLSWEIEKDFPLEPLLQSGKRMSAA